LFNLINSSLTYQVLPDALLHWAAQLAVLHVVAGEKLVLLILGLILPPHEVGRVPGLAGTTKRRPPPITEMMAPEAVGPSLEDVENCCQSSRRVLRFRGVLHVLLDEEIRQNCSEINKKGNQLFLFKSVFFKTNFK
jgi:hypothetical protein